MDLHLIEGAAPSEAERAAIDAVSGGRDQLLPALHAAQDAAGWISPGAMNHLCRRLGVPPAEAYGVASFYHLLSTEPRPKRVVHACDDLVCRTKKKMEGEPSPCLGQCDRAPAALVQTAGEPPAVLTTGERHVEGTRLLRRVGKVDPESLDEYRATGGFLALRRAREIGPEGVIREIVDAKLVGRGGAAFPAGRKWDAVARAPEKPHYVVCNADESEPGTFKDRVLLEEDPFAIVEAMAIAAFATGSTKAFIYIRGEYPLALRRIANAVRTSRDRGFLDVEIDVRRGAGAYICGEETALFNSIEGLRGEPRNKPPFPTQKGLFGKPTLVNNVETLANVPDIVLEGGPDFPSVETKLFCVSGSVAKPGTYEVRFGTTLRQLLEKAGARPLRAVLLGGTAGTFVTPDEFDVPLTFDGTRAIGASLGSGVVFAIDESMDLRDLLLRIARFFREESCGQCVPCRIGTQRQEEALRRGDVPLLGDIAAVMKDASICGLGHTAAWAVQSAIRKGFLR